MQKYEQLLDVELIILRSSFELHHFKCLTVVLHRINHKHKIPTHGV